MSDNKTEQPTPKRLREAREKGDLCKSQEISTALTVFVLVFYLVAMSDSIYENVSSMFLISFDRFHLPYTEALEQTIMMLLLNNLTFSYPIPPSFVGLKLFYTNLITHINKKRNQDGKLGLYSGIISSCYFFHLK